MEEGVKLQHQESVQVLKEKIETPSFWPTDMIDELKVAAACRRAIEFEVDGEKLDLYVAESIYEYLTKLQSLSGSAAELQARMRMRLEEQRAKAIVAAMTDEEVNFGRMSATLQNKYVEGKIAVYVAAYEYATYINKRMSYAMDAGRSFLSYLKEEMRQQTPIGQR